MKRECGSCHVCCVQVPVAAFEKPAGVPCPQLNVLQPCGACGIYETRPSECKVYTCAWLDGLLLSEELKPDNSGILMEVCRIAWPRSLTLMMGFEHEAGAIGRFAEQLRESAVAGKIIAIIPTDRSAGVRLFGEHDDLAAFDQWTAYCRERGSVTHVMADGTFQHSIGKD